MWLLIGDLHLTDHSKDAHRFEIFPWIKKLQEKYPVAATFLLGDLTDSKDRHSATLVNKIVNGLTSLQPPVYIDKGNHDYSDPKNPFFKFLNHIDGLKFVIKPTVLSPVRPIAIIPHYRDQDEFNQAVQLCADANPAAFLVHQTFEGAIAETGARLNGFAASPIEFLKPPLGVYAGDVHRPQTQGIVTYVGCPYHVRFGDNFEPRALFVDKNGRETDLSFDAPRKWSLTVTDAPDILNNMNLVEGDQVKLTIEVTREEAIDWKTIRANVLAACRELKLDVYGVKIDVKTNSRRERIHAVVEKSHAATFNSFCKAENVATNIKKIGMEIINGNKTIEDNN
jgi:hypothetical protein